MKMFKDMVGKALISIGMSLTIFAIVGIVFDINGAGTFTLDNYGFTKMIIACVLTGMAFGVPTVLYSSEKLPMALASVIHLGIGFTVYFGAASWVGWMPVEAGRKACIGFAAGMIVLGMLIWFCFMKYNKNLAARMNKALAENKKN